MKNKKRFDSDNFDDEFDDELEVEMDSDFSLESADVDEIGDALEFETIFYETVADSDQIHVVAFPDSDGDYPSPKEVELINRHCDRQNLRVMHRISHEERGIATVFDKNTLLTGVMPNYEQHGFSC